MNHTTVDPKQLHKSHMKFWRQAQSTPDQLENRMGQKTGDKLGWETSQEGEHSIPDQMGDKLGDKTRDKKKKKTEGGRHSIPDFGNSRSLQGYYKKKQAIGLREPWNVKEWRPR